MFMKTYPYCVRRDPAGAGQVPRWRSEMWQLYRSCRAEMPDRERKKIEPSANFKLTF